jgi:hypothetical protein
LLVQATVALTIAGVLVQVSVAVTPARTLFVVGIPAGLHPKYPPSGTLFSAGSTSFNCVITCVQLTGWPAQSVADHVRVMTFEQLEAASLSVWINETKSDAPQLSVAVTVGAAGISPTHSTFVFAGEPLIVGGFVKMIAVQVAFVLKPQLSVPVTVMVAGQVRPLSLTVNVRLVPPQVAVPAVAARAAASAAAKLV